MSWQYCLASWLIAAVSQFLTNCRDSLLTRWRCFAGSPPVPPPPHPASDETTRPTAITNVVLVCNVSLPCLASAPRGACRTVGQVHALTHLRHKASLSVTDVTAELDVQPVMPARAEPEALVGVDGLYRAPRACACFPTSDRRSVRGGSRGWPPTVGWPPSVRFCEQSLSSPRSARSTTLASRMSAARSTHSIPLPPLSRLSVPASRSARPASRSPGPLPLDMLMRSP